jgi:hypothetical protein
VPYLVGAVGMIYWSAHTDRSGERKWYAVIAFLFIIAGVGLASGAESPTLKMLFLCLAGLDSLLRSRCSGPCRPPSLAERALRPALQSIPSAISVVISARRYSAYCDHAGSDVAGPTFLAGRPRRSDDRGLAGIHPVISRNLADGNRINPALRLRSVGWSNSALFEN